MFGDWRARYSQVTDTLRRVDADVICLQETFDAAKSVAVALGYHHVAAVDWFEPMQIHGGAAVLSRWPITEADSLVPPAEHPAGSGLFQAAKVSGPRGPALIVNAMLAWRPDHSDIRQSQVRALGAWIKARRGHGEAAVLCGDFNGGEADLGSIHEGTTVRFRRRWGKRREGSCRRHRHPPTRR